MSYRRVIQLWENDLEECHGGENNGGARRVFCPASTKYSNLKGLSSWANRLAFGTFASGHGSDPARGGGLAGQANAVDYVTGMPDLRTEHLHAIDCGGFDRLRIVWKAECIAYEGLRIDWANVPLDTNSPWADGVYAIAFGEEVIETGLDYLNFPPALWANANDTLAGEGQGSSNALQCLTNSPLTGGTSWTRTGDFALSADTAVYTHSTGTGTLNQASGSFAGGVVGSKRYMLKYTVSSSTVAGGSLDLSGVGTATGLPRTNGQHVVEFTTASSPGNFVLTNTSTSGNMTIDDIFLVLDLRAGSDKRPRPMFAAPNNGVFAESELFRAPGALAIRGQSVVPGALSDMSRYGNAKIPNGLPVASTPSQQVAWGATQWGITYKGPTGIPYSRIPRAGDRYKVVLDIGLPTMSTPGTAAPAVGQDALSQDLWITGLSRVYFAMASVGVHFVQSPAAGEAPTYLQSVPIGPAVAPRQHIKGRLYAVLSSLTPHPKGSPE